MPGKVTALRVPKFELKGDFDVLAHNSIMHLQVSQFLALKLSMYARTLSVCANSPLLE